MKTHRRRPRAARKFLFAADGDHANDATRRETRTGIAHDDFRGMAVEPEKAQAGAGEARRRRDVSSPVRMDRHLLQIIRNPEISGGIGGGNANRANATVIKLSRRRGVESAIGEIAV